MTADAPKPTTAAERKKISRRRFLRRVGTAALLCGATGVYATQVEPFWVDEHEYTLPMRNLPASFAGFRIVQLTDLHASGRVPMSYLQRVIDRVNQIKPDLVLVTGDLVTDELAWAEPIAAALGTLTPATIVTFGNHDYATMPNFANSTEIADALESALTQRGCAVLRNRAIPVTHADGRLWIVGLEDLWSGRFSPDVAFAGINPAEPIIAMSHNPDTAPQLDSYGAQWILAGHTHGGQIRLPGYGQIMFNVHNHEYQMGEYQLPNSRMYISRGIGYLLPARMFCRPELPCFVLSRAS